MIGVSGYEGPPALWFYYNASEIKLQYGIIRLAGPEGRIRPSGGITSPVSRSVGVLYNGDDCPVICLRQTDRSSKHQAGKRPTRRSPHRSVKINLNSFFTTKESCDTIQLAITNYYTKITRIPAPGAAHPSERVGETAAESFGKKRENGQTGIFGDPGH